VTKVSEPPRTGQEQLQIAVANANHRQPEEMFPQLDRSKGEPDRQARATQQAVSQYMSNPQNQARIQRKVSTAVVITTQTGLAARFRIWTGEALPLTARAWTG